MFDYCKENHKPTFELLFNDIKKEKKNKLTFRVLKGQLTKVLDRKFDKNNIIVAYEPIWSIGTGKIPSKNELEKTAIYIKKVLKDIFKKSPALLYGGSVDGNNVEMFKEIREIDGIEYMNCGDWVESCTALAEKENGEICIIDYGNKVNENEQENQIEVA